MKSNSTIEELLENINVADNVLLSGAGFTKDFGGFLADEMWSLIYNSSHLKSCPEIRNLMRNNFNYEEVYSTFSGTPFIENDSDINALEEAIFEAYLRIDKEVSEYNGLYINGLEDLVELFNGKQGNKGFFFTLNQDILVERNVRVALPWIIHQEPMRKWSFNRNNHFITLPDQIELTDRMKKNELRGESLCYIKLHGSFNWKGNDSRSRMVIGVRKEDQIIKEPLLKEYYELFKIVLRKAKRLLIIGYGFNDQHINKEISQTIENSKQLELYVISPESPKKFMTKIDHFKPIAYNLNGYFPYKLSDIFNSRGIRKDITEIFL